MTGRRCEAISNLSGARCTDTAAGHYIKACEHEHFEPRWLCAGHVIRVVAAVCGACYRHPTDPHCCPVALIPDTESAVAS